MGAFFQAVCSCGYEALAATGSSRANHGRVFLFAHACSPCGELVNVDLLANPATCPKCSGTLLRRFGIAVPNKKVSSRLDWLLKPFMPTIRKDSESETRSIAENPVTSTYCYNLKTTFHLPADGNQCPKCNQPNLKFEYPCVQID
jgi:hypothetical protein